MLLDRRYSREAFAALDLLSHRMLSLRPTSANDPSLQNGLAGLAIAHAALDVAFPTRGHAARAARALDRATAILARRPLPPGLYTGFTGVAWALEFLSSSSPALSRGADCINDSIDEALEIYLSRPDWPAPFDVIEGLVGTGVYALERLPRAAGARLIALIVGHLEGTAQPNEAGLAWRSDPQWLRRKDRREPHPEWNLGVAHGVPGIVGLLGRIVASEVAPETRKKAGGLLEAAVPWLLAQELPDGADGSFSYAVAPGIGREPARLAWCYGDPGVAATLLLAARATHNAAWEQAALRVAMKAAARSEGSSGVIDAGLCHGAAGVAHIFHRLFLSTGEQRLARAARIWFGRALAMRRSRNCFGGFAAWTPGIKGKLGWHAETGFLTGGAGVALALVAATLEAADPGWDRALMLS